MLGVPTYVSAVQQDTHFTMDEKGVMGAAYTVVEMMTMSLLESERALEHLNFVLDKPFMYAVVSPEGAPRFVGALVNP